ncbi:helix-turn-helix domain-containing protein [Actinophytocola sp.]|uniref:helix-turn-helix domain-containing protein n=1 Tax=Actinophytocola sp. TaxID=1872138 RepID=UPI002ED67B56
MAVVSSETATNRQDVWRDLLRDHFVTLDVVDAQRDAFDGAVRSENLAHLQISDVRSINQDIIRSTELLRRDRERYLQVGLILTGGARVEQDGRSAVLGRGDFVVYETERPFEWRLRSGTQWDLAVFTWPRDTIQLSESESAALTCHTLSGATGITGVLSRMLTDLLTAKPTLSGAAAARIADEVGELVTTVAEEACGRAAETDRHAGLLRQVDAYIDEHLGDPDLSPTLVAQAHFLSTRQLQRMFASRGQTVTQVIRRRRLERCRRDLLTCRGGEPTLTAVCFRWGFTDLAVFSRAFREAYGMSPTAYRSQAR